MREVWNALVVAMLLGLGPGLPGRAGEPASGVTLVIVTGIAGAEEYESVFSDWSRHWRETGEQAGAQIFLIGENEAEEGEPSDRERLREVLAAESVSTEGELWIILNGHGTFDGSIAKFNLRGRDVSASDLSEWLKACKRPMALVSGFSASAPFINALSGPNRVIVSATKSGHELNYSRFGGYVSEAITSLEADLDKDGQVSLLEAFLKGARDTDEFYALEGRLASEHALIDDTGDRKGTGFDWFRGVRLIREAKGRIKPDGRRAHQFHLLRSEFEQHMPAALREKRDALEMKILELRDQKKSFTDEDEYYAKLEGLFLQMGALYSEVEARMEAVPGSGSEASPE